MGGVDMWVGLVRRWRGSKCCFWRSVILKESEVGKERRGLQRLVAGHLQNGRHQIDRGTGMCVALCVCVCVKVVHHVWLVGWVGSVSASQAGAGPRFWCRNGTRNDDTRKRKRLQELTLDFDRTPPSLSIQMYSAMI